jgi:hypothetical protein
MYSPSRTHTRAPCGYVDDVLRVARSGRPRHLVPLLAHRGGAVATDAPRPRFPLLQQLQRIVARAEAQCDEHLAKEQARRAEHGNRVDLEVGLPDVVTGDYWTDLSDYEPGPLSELDDRRVAAALVFDAGTDVESLLADCRLEVVPPGRQRFWPVSWLAPRGQPAKPRSQAIVSAPLVVEKADRRRQSTTSTWLALRPSTSGEAEAPRRARRAGPETRAPRVAQQLRRRR